MNEAETQFLKAIKIVKNSYGEKHPYYIIIKEKLEYLYKNKKWLI